MLDESSELLNNLSNEFPDTPRWYSDLGENHRRSAQLEAQAGNANRARELFAMARADLTKAASVAPSDLIIQTRLMTVLYFKTDFLIRIGDYRAAAETANEMVSTRKFPMDSFQAAMLLASCADLADTDESMSASERDKLGATYASRALELCRSAVRGGLEPGMVRMSEEAFNKFMHDLEARVAESQM
jgi:hypothetical protein